MSDVEQAKEQAKAELREQKRRKARLTELKENPALVTIKRNTTSVSVYDDENLFYGDLPSKATEFIKFFQDKIDLIPAEYRDIAKIDMVPKERWDCMYYDISISYERPETDDEAAIRQEKIEYEVEEERREELAEIQRLTDKYGITVNPIVRFVGDGVVVFGDKTDG